MPTEDIKVTTQKLPSLGARWIVGLLVVAQPILLGIGYQSIQTVQTKINNTQAQLEGIDPAISLVHDIVEIGEYRGACSADQLLFSRNPKISDLCDHRKTSLREKGLNLPEFFSATPSTFFTKTTQVNDQLLEKLNHIYIDSKAILDSDSITNQLGYEVYRFYPSVIEQAGRARGIFAHITHSDMDKAELSTIKGAVTQLGKTFVENILLGNGDVKEYEGLVSDITRYIEKIDTELAALRANPSESAYEEANSRLFDEGNLLIHGLLKSTLHDFTELNEILEERLTSLKYEECFTLLLFTLLQLTLIISGLKSFQTLRLLKASVQREADARDGLEKILQKQKEMFAIIGHELRTPVAAIKMIVDDEDESSESKINQVSDISSSLLDVLEDLRVVIAPERALEAKRDSGGNPVSVTRRALAPLNGMLANHGMTLDVRMPNDTSNHYSFYMQPLRQCVTNLVKNAAIHSGGTKIAVSLSIIRNEDGSGRAKLTVEDDGKGIPEHLRETVFEAFGRGDTQSDGSGLGLFIVKQMAEMMEGEMTYRTSPLGGAAFDITFALHPVIIEMNDVSDSTEDVSLQDMRIMVAEDEKMLRMLTENVLKKEGAVVHSYENGKLALDAYSPEKFDIVITDLMMPEMDGHGLTRGIREQSDNTIIIAVTAAVLGAETEQFISEGADYVLPKPINKRALTDALNEIKARHKQHGE